MELPRVERPFKIALRADSDGQGMVMIDHLQVNVSYHDTMTNTTYLF